MGNVVLGHTPGTDGPIEIGAAPTNGVSEIQTVTITGSPGGGTITLKYDGFETAAIASNAAASAVQTALRALLNIGSDGCSVSGSNGGPFTVSFAGHLAVLAINTMTLGTNLLTGGTAPSATIVKATAGVSATKRDQSPGCTLVDTTNGKQYINAGIAGAPIWTPFAAKEGVQTSQVTVLSAAVLTLNTTPVTLVPAQGAGTIIIVDAIVAKEVFGTIAYTGANNLEFRYTNGSGAKVSADIAAAFINSASGTNYASVSGVATSLTPVANSPVVVSVPVANPAAGDSNIVFTVTYRVLTP